MAYLVMFVISILFVATGLKTPKKTLSKALIVLGLIIPCVMAALRNVNVGTDTNGYIYNLYKMAFKSKSLFNFFSITYKNYLQKDYIYTTITYFIGKNRLGFGTLLFIYECLIVFPIYISFKKLKFSKMSIIIGLISFYFILYNVTYNMLRQSIAIAFTTLAFSQYVTSSNRKEKVLSYLFALIAFGFHSTAIVIIPIFWLYSFYSSKKIDNKYKLALSIIIVASSILFIAFHRVMLTFIGKTGIYPLALFYLKKYSVRNFGFYQSFINVLIISIIIYNKKDFIKSKIPYTFILTLSLINFLISTGLGYFISYSQRIVLYIQYILVFCFIPRIKYKGEANKKVVLLYVLLLLISWLLYFVYKNVHETNPYQLFLIN